MKSCGPALYSFISGTLYGDLGDLFESLQLRQHNQKKISAINIVIFQNTYFAFLLRNLSQVSVS